MKFFNNIQTLEALKKEYRKLSKQYHPDLNPAGLEAMKQINNEYELLFEQLKKHGTQEEQQEDVSIFKDIISKIIHLDIEIEIVGTWIWVDGNTYSCKETLKELGFQWRPRRKKWSFGELKSKRGSNESFDQLRARHGSKKVESKTYKKLA